MRSKDPYQNLPLYKVSKSRLNEKTLEFSIQDLERLKTSPDGDTPQNCLTKITKTLKIEDFSHKNADQSLQIVPTQYHGFADAVYKAYQTHHTLQLSVSDFIILIGQGFATHIDMYSVQLRQIFVDHEGKEEIQVRHDEFVLGQQNDWSNIIPELADQVKRKVKEDIYSIFIDDTSIATNTTKIASQFNLLQAMKNYYEYSVKTCCGIPKFILKGKPDDWRSLKQKVYKLKELNDTKKLQLDFWLGSLVPVIEQVCEAGIDESIDPEFWDSILKIPGGSGGTKCTGWINALYPYIQQSYGNNKKRNPNLKVVEGRVDSNTFKNSDLEFENLMQSIQNLQFKWEYLGQIIPTYFFSGFLGVKKEKNCDNGEIVYSPEVFWAIGRAEQAEKTMKVIKEKENTSSGGFKSFFTDLFDKCNPFRENKQTKGSNNYQELNSYGGRK